MRDYVITIARGLGSNGSHIGKKLASDLGIKYYDDEILKLASDLSGINETFFFEANEKIKKGQFAINNSKGVYTGYIYGANSKEYLSNENLYNIQAKVISSLALADGEACIIIGKAANYILREFPKVLKINIQAPIEYCVKTLTKRTGEAEAEAEKRIIQTNKYRSDYYKYYTGKNWMDPAEYDLSLNPALLTEDYCVELIKHIIATKQR
jgi:Cytidylate kinase